MFSDDNDLIEDRPRRWRVKWWLLGSVVAVLVAVGIWSAVGRISSPIHSHPASTLLIAGEQAMTDGQYDAALSSFQQAEAQGGELPIEILYSCAEASLRLGRVAKAEQYLRQLLARDEQHLGANEMLCALLRVAGRNWELRAHALKLMQHGEFSPSNLVALAASTGDVAVKRGTPAETDLENLIIEGATAQSELVARTAQARYFISHNHQESALPLLREVVAEDPLQLEAQALLGSLLLSSDAHSEFHAWQRRLPESAMSHPELWVLRGRWAEQRGARQEAARCYWEALRLHPDHQGATYRLSQMLSGLGRAAEAQTLADRAAQLAEMKTFIASGWSPPSNIRKLAEGLEAIGHQWEALGWSQATLARDPKADNEWARECIARLSPTVDESTPLVLAGINPAAQLDLSAWPLPDWNTTEGESSGLPTSSINRSQVAFVDSAAAAGLTFTYFNGADPNDKRAYVFEFSGGGAAVLDYDADGWPDLFLTQGCTWPPVSGQTQYSDRLFRNLGNGKFADVTEQAGLRDSGYGQGVSAGDIDNDGLPDLYVANIGANQLYHNNGDGTFTDITSDSGLAGAVWTISTLIADLNGDSWPELYDVTYLSGSNLFTEECFAEGEPVQCYPNQFPAEMDHVFQNQGDGRFQDVSQAAGIEAPDGKGMGVIAADFDGSRRLSLFISNDTTPNFFFLNQTLQPSGDLLFAEQGLLTGVALSESGATASCMGIAAGDSNGDDLIDLFVTNFQDEANNLYVQREGLLFDDQIRRSRLHDPGFQMEGWGAQFLDADLDGKMDLVVANGHLDDYPHSRGQNRMPTQFFHNVGEGHFAELPAKDLGPYFETPYLGRALARLDWNRDGLPDFCVTHVDTPFALLTNQTSNPGRSLVLHLRAVRSARDAIGTKVTIRAGDQSWTQQLLAGDGFAASNERQITFGLQSIQKVDELTVEWPSGLTQTYHDLETNRELLFVEARAAPYRLSK